MSMKMKESKKEFWSVLWNVAIDTTMYLSIIGVLPIPEVVFKALYIFFIAVYTISFVLLMLAIALRIKYKDRTFEPEPKEVMWSKSKFNTMAGTYAAFIFVASFVAVFEGYSTFSIGFYKIFATHAALVLFLQVIVKVMRMMDNTSKKERIILSFINSPYHAKIVREYMNIKDSMLMDAPITNKELKKELRKIQDYYFSLLRA